MDRLFGHLMNNMVHYMLFRDETEQLTAIGCKKINPILCALYRTYERETRTNHPSIEEFVAFHTSVCTPSCDYHVHTEDAIPANIYAVTEYGRFLHCRSLYLFMMFTHIENRYPNEEEFNLYEDSLTDEDDILHDEPVERNEILDQFQPYVLKESLPDKNCCICQESLEKNQQVITLPCFHTFHTEYKNSKGECLGIEQWLKHSKDCPLCKRSVTAL